MASPEEAAQVEQLAAQHPEVKAELEAISVALETYATEFSTQPPAQLKARILDSIFNEDDQEEDNQRYLSPSPTHWFNGLSIAASLLLAISVALNIFFYQRWQRSSDRLAALELEQYYTAENLRKANFELENTRESLAVLKDKNNVIVNLKGLDNSPESNAVVVWNSQSKHVYLVASNLPEPPSEELQYQLWAIIDGKPVDAGVFNTTDEVQQLKDMISAEAFAITLEKKGGSPTPQGTMYVLGTVKV